MRRSQHKRPLNWGIIGLLDSDFDHFAHGITRVERNLGHEYHFTTTELYPSPKGDGDADRRAGSPRGHTGRTEG